MNVWRELGKLRDIFRQPQYMLVAVVVATAAFTVYTLLLNYQLLFSLLASGNVALLTKLVPTLVLGYGETVGTTTLLFTATISAAIGVNFTLVMFRLVELSAFGREGAGSLGGMVLAAVAPACPACATAIFAVAGMTSVFAVMPFNGVEFKVVALLLLVGSSFWILSQINQKVCEFC